MKKRSILQLSQGGGRDSFQLVVPREGIRIPFMADKCCSLRRADAAVADSSRRRAAEAEISGRRAGVAVTGTAERGGGKGGEEATENVTPPNVSAKDTPAALGPPSC